jgi:SAM-dependent methyltransferase
MTPGDPTTDFTDELRRLANHYGELFRQHGDAPAAAQWRDQESQEKRFEILAQIADLREAKVLDFGCGTARLLSYLRRTRDFRGEYVGYDLNPELVDRARRQHPEGRFETRDVLASGVPEDFDYVLISGVFNNLLSDNWGFMTALLRLLFPHARKGLAFNAISTYVDNFAPELYYVDPGKVFHYCKEVLSPRVTLRHEYEVKPGVVPYEFSVYVFRATYPTRPRRDFES